MSLKESVIAEIEKFRLRFDFLSSTERAARKVMVLLDDPHIGFLQEDKRQFHDLVCQLIIDKLTLDYKDICCATLQTHGIPYGFAMRLQLLGIADGLHERELFEDFQTKDLMY